MFQEWSVRIFLLFIIQNHSKILFLDTDYSLIGTCQSSLSSIRRYSNQRIVNRVLAISPTPGMKSDRQRRIVIDAYCPEDEQNRTTYFWPRIVCLYRMTRREPITSIRNNIDHNRTLLWRELFDANYIHVCRLYLSAWCKQLPVPSWSAIRNSLFSSLEWVVIFCFKSVRAASSAKLTL